MAKGRKTGGRQKGTPNRATVAGREVFAALFEGNRDKAQAKLDAIEDPAKWMDAYLRIGKFCVPELNRTQVEGADGGPVEFVIRDIAKET